MELLYILLVILVIARLFGELSLRIHQPALVGELIAGVLVGMVAHQFADRLPVLASLPDNEVFIALSDLGVFFLMIVAGLEMQPRDVAKSAGGALGVAVGGMVLPLAAGLGLAWFFIPASDVRLPQMFFVGTALATTAIPVAVKVLMDLGQLKTKAGQIIVSSAIFDNILCLVLLAMFTALIEFGQWPGAAGLLLLGGKIALFFAVTISISTQVLPRIASLMGRAWIEEFEFSALLVVALAFGLLAESLALHFILGAFVAGLFFTRRMIDKKTYQDVQQKVGAITTGFLAPVFFVSIGLHLDLSALREIPLFVVLLILVAIVSKLVGSGLAARWSGLSPRESWVVGIGMTGRGAIELIIADIAFRAGLFSQPQPLPPVVAHLFSAVVIMAIVTTLLVPVGIRIATRDA